MGAPDYPFLVRTIEQIRLDNFQRLVAELTEEIRRDPTAAEIAAFTGISTVYAWQIQSGKRKSIESKAARRIDRHTQKGEGWMDTDYMLWPFPGIPPSRFETLKRDDVIEIQALVKKALREMEDDRAAQVNKLGGRRHSGPAQAEPVARARAPPPSSCVDTGRKNLGKSLGVAEQRHICMAATQNTFRADFCCGPAVTSCNRKQEGSSSWPTDQS